MASLTEKFSAKHNAMRASNQDPLGNMLKSAYGSNIFIVFGAETEEDVRAAVAKADAANTWNKNVFGK